MFSKKAPAFLSALLPVRKMWYTGPYSPVLEFHYSMRKNGFQRGFWQFPVPFEISI